MADESIARLMGMGFEFDLVINALQKANNNEPLAIQYLTNKPKPRKKLQKKKNTDHISWEDGRRRIYDSSIKPFFERIENVFNGTNIILVLNQSQYMIGYDAIFTLCIQREPYNYSKSCYDLHINSLKQYFNHSIKSQLKNTDNINDIAYFNKFILQYKKCKIAMDGLNRLFFYLNRFHVPNNDGTMTLEGHSLLAYYTEIFHIYSKHLIKILFKCINICRQHKLSIKYTDCNMVDMIHETDYYKMKQLIKICVNIISSIDNGLNEEEKNTKTKLIKRYRTQFLNEKDELFVHGFLREMANNMEYNIVPVEIDKLIITYYGKSDMQSIYDEYFWNLFKIQTMNYYNTKCIEINNHSHKLSQHIQFIQKCVDYEVDQIKQITGNQNDVRNDINDQFIDSLCNKLYDEQSVNQHFLNLCKIKNQYISINEIKNHFIDIYESLHILNNGRLKKALIYRPTANSSYKLMSAVHDILIELFNKYATERNDKMSFHDLQTFMLSLDSVKKLNFDAVEGIMEKYGTKSTQNIYTLNSSSFVKYYENECILRPNIVWNDLKAFNYDLRKNNTSSMMKVIIENAMNDINILFNHYIERSKKYKLSKDIYKKYQLIYDTFDIYQLFIHHNELYLDRKYDKMIKKIFFHLFINLIQKEYEYITILVNKFINYMLMNCDCIRNIELFMNYIGFIYNKLLIFARPNIIDTNFEKKYRYFLMKRFGSNKHLLSNKHIYFEQKMAEKLDNWHLKQAVHLR